MDITELREFISRNEFHTEVELSSEAYWVLEERIRDEEGIYVDIIEEIDNESIDAKITLDLDERGIDEI